MRAVHAAQGAPLVAPVAFNPAPVAAVPDVVVLAAGGADDRTGMTPISSFSATMQSASGTTPRRSTNPSVKQWWPL